MIWDSCEVDQSMSKIIKSLNSENSESTKVLLVAKTSLTLDSECKCASPCYKKHHRLDYKRHKDGSDSAEALVACVLLAVNMPVLCISSLCPVTLTKMIKFP